MQRAMQTYATVFRTGSMLQEGKEALREVAERSVRHFSNRPVDDLEFRI